MKANELRIGNIVDLGNRIGTVNCIYPNAVTVVDHERTQDTIEDFDRVCGVHLTEEWLLRAGFVIGNRHYNVVFSLELLKTDFYLRKSFMGGYYWGFNVSDRKNDCEFNDVQPLQYVHQLQNLYFALTGEELQFKDI